MDPQLLAIKFIFVFPGHDQNCGFIQNTPVFLYSLIRSDPYWIIFYFLLLSENYKSIQSSLGQFLHGFEQ